MKKRLIYCFIFINSISFGQLGSWNILTLKYKFNSHWQTFAEGQIRSLSFYNEFHYFEYKGGFTYSLNDYFGFGPMVGHYRTYSPNDNFNQPILSNELRTCIQIFLKQKVNKIEIEHRYRIEQRFTSNGYRNRFRYRIGIDFPIYEKKEKNKSLSLNFWNEIFFTDKAQYFERNRFSFGLTYQVNKKLSFFTGYLHQFDYNLVDEIGRDFLQIGIGLDLSK